MDIEIGELENVIQVTDAQALLEPKILERIICEVLTRLKEHKAHEKLSDADRNYKSSVTGGR